MAGYNSIRPNRDQLFFMPPALQDWLPSDDMVYFLLDAVDQLCAEHVRQLGGASPLHNLMEVKC